MDPQLEQDLRLDLAVPEVFDPGADVIEKRFQTYSAVDPYPDIPPALLNSADLLDYTAATGMIYPFRISMSELSASVKPGTYGVPLLGKYVYWERTTDGSTDRETHTKHVGELQNGDELTLRPNTITYVELEPFFRLPRYIAARFNLAIRDIYRGILVGTGPLVDPGFEGRLSVPLHNLTSNEYTLVGGEPLVWMEFTKLSPSQNGWGEAIPSQRPPRRGIYVEFPPRKKELALEDYLRKAHSGAIVSSIPAAIGRAVEAAERAREDAKQARSDADSSKTTIRNLGIGGGVAILLALAAILVPTWSLIHDASDRQDDTVTRVQKLEQQVAVQQAAINREQNAIAALRRRLVRTHR